MASPIKAAIPVLQKKRTEWKKTLGAIPRVLASALHTAAPAVAGIRCFIRMTVLQKAGLRRCMISIARTCRLTGTDRFAGPHVGGAIDGQVMTTIQKSPGIILKAIADFHIARPIGMTVKCAISVQTFQIAGLRLRMISRASTLSLAQTGACTLRRGELHGRIEITALP